MTKTNRHWTKRFEIIKEIELQTSLPLSNKINIQHYEAFDNVLNQKAILKLIDINEDPSIADLARYLWHYEISLNQRATNNSQGKTLLKLIYAKRDELKGKYILITESGGKPLRDFLLSIDESEDMTSFKNFLKPSNKKNIWEPILNLIKGLSSLHSSGLLHRNISIDSIYFDAEAYRQGEKNILKLGDFSWTIYLYSLSNIFTDEISSEIIKDNYQFFRAPECVPIEEDLECYGETYLSDMFSLGLVLSFLFIDFDLRKCLDSNLNNRNEIYSKIYEELQNYKGYPLETEILLKLIEINPDDRFQNINELIDKIRELLNIFKFNYIRESKLPLNFKLDRTSPLLRYIADSIEYNINALVKEPSKFLLWELKESKLCLTNDLRFPLWSKGKSGIYYKFGKAYKRNNIAQVRYFIPGKERDLELTDDEICIVEDFYWIDINDSCAYSNWEEIFANANLLIKEKNKEISTDLQSRVRWIEVLNIISTAEEEIEKRKILEYDLINDSKEKNESRDTERELIINILYDEDKDLFTDIIEEAQYHDFELTDNDNLFTKFKTKRLWKFQDIIEETRNYTTIKLKGSVKNEDPFDHGNIRVWDLRNTTFLLKRKRQIIQNLKTNEHLLSAILQPASTHMYFEDYDKRNIVSFIYYTNPIFLLQGPPGTGKTWTAKELIRMTLERDPFSRILVASKEHSALDDLLKKCVDMLNETDISPSPNIVRLISPERELLYQTDSIPYQHLITQTTRKVLKKIANWKPKNDNFNEIIEELNNIIQDEINSPSKEWIQLIKESSNLVFCTTTAYDLKELEYLGQNFDLVVIEEAGKTYPSELFKPMQLGNKWVLIGDQNQLPPFRIEDIEKIIEENLKIKEKEMEENEDFNPKDFLKFKKEVKSELKVFNSMFEKFQNIKHSFDENDTIKSCDTLMQQYRLPSIISKMISSTFYDQEFMQKIIDPIDFILKPIQFKNQQLIWIKTPNNREYQERREGVNLFNIMEAKLITSLLSKLKIKKEYFPITLAILSPYKEQVELLKKIVPKELNNLQLNNIRNMCYTVDSFQGQEADLVIISLVRNNNYENSRKAWGFIPSPERLNVMLSRAKKAQIIVGNIDMCKLHERDSFMSKFNKVVNFIEREGVVIDYKDVI